MNNKYNYVYEKIAPSIFAADFTEIGKAIDKIEEKGCKYIHIDIMDGHFVPNISFGPKITADIKKRTKCLLDVHLMVENPLFFLDAFKNAGADIFTIHYETGNDCGSMIQKIKSKGLKTGMSIKPATNIDVVLPFVQNLDLLLIMSVEPGFSGQSIMMEQIEKIEQIKKMREKRNFFIIEVDGGITFDNMNKCLEKGADLLVMGSAFFKKSV